jgi:peptide chain release factor 3
MAAAEPAPLVAAEAARRRTFAIIAHPDAGKTTLTEKLLLYAGMVRTAGMVKNRKNGRLATSDWMSMEQERGISITASAMQFEYGDCVLNVLDTPGHQDFSVDTYRTLTAADCAIMVLDAAKGVETQTKKLFQVCALRGIPVVTFVNKCDLPARPGLEILAEVEDVLGIKPSAMNWPTGSGSEFDGVVDIASGDLLHFTKAAAGGAKPALVERTAIASERAAALLGPRRDALADEAEMLRVAGEPFTRERFLDLKVTPVFFGSAFTNFGVEPFFDAFVRLSPPPSPRPVAVPVRGGDPAEAQLPITAPFSGYVFKIQANMNPKHRDCLAFIRICSGRFERDMVARHLRDGEIVRELRLSRPHTMVAASRTTLDDAWPGDVVGVINNGFAIGDTLLVGSGLPPELRPGFSHAPLPQFPPECFAQVAPADLGKRKPFDKGMETLGLEGAVQVLRSWHNPQADPFIAAVGRLQFEVLQYRLKDEFGVETRLEPLPYQASGWLIGPVETFTETPGSYLARDGRGRAVVLFPSRWDRDYCQKQNPDHRLVDFA